MKKTNMDISYLDLLTDNQKMMFNGLSSLKELGLMYQYIEDKTYNGRKIKVNNKELLYFGSCNYMGLETHPEIIKKSREAVERYGTQISSSRAGVSSVLYKETEDMLSQIFPGNHIITQTVTLGHFSVLPLLIQEQDAIIIDAFAHNSIRMACSICKANGTFTIISKHNDIDNIRYLTKRLEKDGYRNIWYCTDSVFSMQGNFLKIQEINKLLNEQDNFFAYVDDAHGTGWYGEKGRGFVFDNIEIHPRMVVIESFAKSMASSGGVIIVKEKELANIIRVIGQTLMFSGQLQPAILGAIQGSLGVLLSAEYKNMQNELHDLIVYFRNESKKYGLPVITEDETPIQVLRIGDVNKTLKILEKLNKLGFFIISAVYPAVPVEDSGLRVSLTRHIKKKDIDNLLQSIIRIIKEYNV